MPVRVRFAPSPTGSLHLGNALTAVANRSYADREQGMLILRIDDTDESRNVDGGVEAILDDLHWLGITWDERPVRQSERGAVYENAARRALEHGAETDADGSIRLGRTTLVRADGTATYQLASVADDLDLGVTHVIRGSDHRPNEALQRHIGLALGGSLPQVIHHGLILGADGKKLSKRHGHSSVADLRREGIPAAAVRAYLEELGMPTHDVKLDPARLHRLSIDAIAAMSDDVLAAEASAPLEVVPALRGARDLVEARLYAEQISRPQPVGLSEATDTLGRFAELRGGYPEWVGEAAARELVRELKAVGGDLKALRLALTGVGRGPELWTVVAALPGGEARARALAAAQTPSN